MDTSGLLNSLQFLCFPCVVFHQHHTLSCIANTLNIHWFLALKFSEALRGLFQLSRTWLLPNHHLSTPQYPRKVWTPTHHPKLLPFHLLLPFSEYFRHISNPTYVGVHILPHSLRNRTAAPLPALALTLQYKGGIIIIHHFFP